MRLLGLFFASMFSMLAFTVPAQAAPVCGNGVLESGEDCDDRDICTTDGCDPELGCVYEPYHGYNIFTEEVAPGEPVFDRFVPFFALHVASGPTQVPVLHPVGIALAGLILLAGGVGGLRRRRYVTRGGVKFPVLHPVREKMSEESG